VEHIPIGTLVKDAVFDWVSENFRYLDPARHISIIYTIRPGSIDLRSVYEKIRSNEIPYANDTSVGVGFYPLSETEKVCLMAEKTLNDKKFKAKYPAVGEDIKVMCVRVGEKINMTVAMAMIDRELRDSGEYFAVKEQVREELTSLLTRQTRFDIDVKINTADDPKLDIYYITVTGTSAESGDDGQIGRGNRWNGLITPLRYMSIEAHAGKNPVSHVGKIYQFAAQHAAERIFRETGVDEVYVLLVSTIGQPINKPQIAYIQYIGEGDSDLEADMRAILNEVLDFIPKFWREFISGRVSPV